MLGCIPVFFAEVISQTSRTNTHFEKYSVWCSLFIWCDSSCSIVWCDFTLYYRIVSCTSTVGTSSSTSGRKFPFSYTRTNSFETTSILSITWEEYQSKQWRGKSTHKTNHMGEINICMICLCDSIKHAEGDREGRVSASVQLPRQQYSRQQFWSCAGACSRCFRCDHGQVAFLA